MIIGKSLNLKRCFLFLERVEMLSLRLGFGRRVSRGREEQAGGRRGRGEPGEGVAGGSGGTFFPFLFNIFDI